MSVEIALNRAITLVAAKFNPLTAVGNRTSVFFKNDSAIATQELEA